MNPKSLILLVVAGISVVLVVVLTRMYLSGMEQSAQTVQVAAKPQSKILVAAKDLPVGTIITPEDMVAQNWPDGAMNAAYYKAGINKSDMAGKVVRRAVTMGEPITKSSLVAQGERGFLAAILTPGMRAVTVKLNIESGIGGFVFPGDRVDVILTHEVSDDNNQQHIIAETVLQNVRVLGVDQRSEKAADKIKLGKSATLEVSPKMAEKVAMLSRIGSLSLSLRALAQSDDVAGEAPINATLSRSFGSDVSTVIPAMDEASSKGKIMVARGAALAEVDAQGALGKSQAQLNDERPIQ